jgi:outer membrane immunogenic protein
MSNKLVLAALFAGATLTSVPAFSQEEGPAYKSEATVQALGSFLKTTTSGGADQSSTNSGGVLASYRYFFTRHHGVEVNYGYNRNTQSYTFSDGSAGFGSNTHEVSADYVLRFPHRRWTPFALAGVGALVFDPRSSVASFTGSQAALAPNTASAQTRAAFVYGAGADINLTNHVYLRAQYRGFVFNSPTYDVVTLNGLDRTTHLAEPSIGFGYRF